VTAAALVEALRSRGVELVPVGDRLRFRPASKIPPELLERLRERKGEVIAILTARPSEVPSSPPAFRSVRWWAYPWPDELPALGCHSVGPFDLCAECSAWSWVRYGSTVLCLRCARRRLDDPWS
jgi:hypothetical protein